MDRVTVRLHTHANFWHSTPGFLCIIIGSTAGLFVLLVLGGLLASTPEPSRPRAAIESRISACRQEAGGMHGTITKEAMYRFTACLER